MKKLSSIFWIILFTLLVLFVLAPATMIRLITDYDIGVRYNLDTIIEALLIPKMQEVATKYISTPSLNKTEIIL